MKRTMLSARVGVVCLAVLLAGVLLCGPQARAEEPKELKIGVLLAFTGWFSSAGILEKKECDVVTDLVNEAGGVTVKGQKYKIVPVYEDTKSSHEGVSAATNKLVYDKGIKFIVGPNAFWGSASGPICEANKIINVIGFSTNTPGELDKNTQYRILANNSTAGNSYGLIQFIKKAHPEVKSVVVLNPEDGSAKYLGPFYTQALKENGISTVGDLIGYSLQMVDFTPIAQKISQIKADAVFCPNGIDIHIGNLAKGMRELNDNRWLFYSSMALCSAIREVSGKAAAFKVTSGTPTPGAPGTAPQLESYLNKYREKFGDIKSIILQNSMALYLLPQIIQAAQSLDPKVVKDTLPKLNEVKTLMGPGQFCGEKTYGIRNAVTHPYSVQVLDEKGEIRFGGWFKVNVP